MDELYIGIDSSCYTSSVACVKKDGIVLDKRTVLSVTMGECGLRQSDGVFQHIRNLEPLVKALFQDIDAKAVKSVTVSAFPRDCEDSYMPVFLAGRTVAAAVSSALNVPLNFVSHQRGHIRAALLGNEALLGKPHIGMHLSGGTTEIFTVKPYLEVELIGGTTDLSAGQFVDRTGVALGLPFPAGKSLEALANGCSGAYNKLPASVSGADCSFSGVESMVRRSVLAGEPPEAAAYAVYDCLARTIAKMLLNVRETTGLDTALLAGGVASSELLRELLYQRLLKKDIELRFGRSELSSDNAVGAALIGMDMDGM